MDQYQRTQMGHGGATMDPQRQGQTNNGHAAMQHQFEDLNLNGRNPAKNRDDGFEIRHLNDSLSPTAKDGPQSQYDGFILRPAEKSSKRPWGSVKMEQMKLSQDAFWDDLQIRRRRLKEKSMSLAERFELLPADLRSHINDIIKQKSQSTGGTWNVASIKRTMMKGWVSEELLSVAVIVERALGPANGPRPETGMRTGVGGGNYVGTGGGAPMGRPPGMPGAGGIQGQQGMGAPHPGGQSQQGMGGMHPGVQAQHGMGGMHPGGQGQQGMGGIHPGMQGQHGMGGMHPGGQGQQGMGGIHPGMQGQQAPRPAGPMAGGGGMPPQGVHPMPPAHPHPPAPMMPANRPPQGPHPMPPPAHPHPPAPMMPANRPPQGVHPMPPPAHPHPPAPMMPVNRPPQQQQQQKYQRPTQVPQFHVGAGTRVLVPGARGPPQDDECSFIEVVDGEYSSDEDWDRESDEESHSTDNTSLDACPRSPRLDRMPKGHGRAARMSRSPSWSTTPRPPDNRRRRPDQKPLRRRSSVSPRRPRRDRRSSDIGLSDGGHRRDRVRRDSVGNKRSSRSNRHHDRRHHDDDHHRRGSSSEHGNLERNVCKLADTVRTLGETVARREYARQQNLNATRPQLADQLHSMNGHHLRAAAAAAAREEQSRWRERVEEDEDEFRRAAYAYPARAPPEYYDDRRRSLPQNRGRAGAAPFGRDRYDPTDPRPRHFDGWFRPA
ncbi:MAG: hypothetical protein M1815_001897 [Lichina confinis]|nr:MAG: hypothetical protein M1815_001897 [Lichina confinis]